MTGIMGNETLPARNSKTIKLKIFLMIVDIKRTKYQKSTKNLFKGSNQTKTSLLQMRFKIFSQMLKEQRNQLTGRKSRIMVKFLNILIESKKISLKNIK